VKSRGVIYTTTLVVLEGYYNVLRQRAKPSDFDRQCGDANVIATWGDLGKIPEDERPPIPAQMSQVPERMKNSLANLKRMQDAGAIVAAGTDAGNIGTLHRPSLHREFELMAEAGLTPMQILVAATGNAARVFAREPEMGTIAPGKLADLVILDADPLADIRNTRRIHAVIKGGRSMPHSR
jgi:imidazolonepropionase-like amidohydrolase